MKRYMEHVLQSAEKRVGDFLAKQVQERQSCFYGGLEGDLIDVKPTVYEVATMAAVYGNPASRHYAQPMLLEALEKALDFIGRYQREDGSFDFPSCNFHSAPDTAFCFKRLIAAYRLMGRLGEGVPVGHVKEKLLAILKAALAAIRDGGFHTPNHRWAIAAALTQGAGLFQEEPFCGSLKERAAEYLREGIDGNEDGEYAERSTGNYNAVVNQALISLYEETGDVAYLGYVERNLRMMLTYIDPDDAIFTQNSTRQDRGKAVYGDQYFYQYLYLAEHTGDGVLDGAAHKLIRDNRQRGDLAPDCLHLLMLRGQLAEYGFQGYGFLGSYRKYYRDSGVIRVKNPVYTYSVLSGKKNFCYVKFGSLQVALRLGQSYCDTRNFLPAEMEADGQGCTLRERAVGWYYQPFAEPPKTSDWWQMDHRKRDILESSSLITTVRVSEREKGLEFHVATDGLDRLPLRVELFLAPGCVLEGDSFCVSAAPGQSLLLKQGMVTASDGERAVRIGPGVGAHHFSARYSETEAEPDFCLRMGAYTPCDLRFVVEAL